MEHIKKNWIWYLLGLIAVIVLAMNWKKWFGKKNGGVTGPKAGDTCTDTNGNTSVLDANLNCIEVTTGGGENPTSRTTSDDSSAEKSFSSAPSTYCMNITAGTTCQPRICYVNGKWYTNPSQFGNCGKNSVWYVIDTANSSSTKCCYKKAK